MYPGQGVAFRAMSRLAEMMRSKALGLYESNFACFALVTTVGRTLRAASGEALLLLRVSMHQMRQQWSSASWRWAMEV